MGKKTKSNKPPDKLTPEEVDVLVRTAAKLGRHGHRDATMIRVGFRHGFRVSELCALKWVQVRFAQKSMDVVRAKKGTPGTHDLGGEEMRMLRRVLKESPNPESEYVFVTERGKKMHPRTFFDIIQRAGREAGITVNCHPHILRHACGYAMVNRGTDIRLIQSWLGHNTIEMTVLYTQLGENRLRGLWGD